jgi:outer membrane receptor protein involved in Fe transport
MLRKLLLSGILCLSLTGVALAQTGKLSGRITDKETKEAIPFASIIILKDGVQKGGTSSDFEGNYEFYALVPGSYNVKVSFVGYAEKTIAGVVINFEKTTRLPIELSADVKMTEVVEIYAQKLIDPDNTSTGKTFSSKDIEKLPTRSVTSIINTSSGVFSSDDNGAINIKGARSNTNQYFVNGVKVFGTPNIPVEAISELSVINGGVPAQFGDVTGGVINITTKGPSSRFFGGAAAETSSPFDQWHYNFGSFNLSGPILKKRIIDRNDTTGATTKDLTTIGFFTALQYTYQRDGNPPATSLNVLTEDAQKRIEANPVSFGDIAPGTSPISGENISFNDTRKLKYRPNTSSHNVVFNTTVDFQPAEDISFSVGGTYEYNNSDLYGFGRTLMNSQNNPQQIATNMNAFARFTHFFRGNGRDENALFKNAYYQLQVDYARTSQTTQNREFQDEFFKYNHVGTFKRNRVEFPIGLWDFLDIQSRLISQDPGASASVYILGEDTLRRSDTSTLNYTVLSPIDTFTYSPSAFNPLLSNYTGSYFDYLRTLPSGFPTPFNPETSTVFDLASITRPGSLRNGNLPPSIFGLFGNVGSPFSTYSRNITEQYRGTALFVAQIKKHSVKFGLEYEQRSIRGYGLNVSRAGGNSLWGIAQGYARTGELSSFVIDRDEFGAFDTLTAGAWASSIQQDTIRRVDGPVNGGNFATNLWNRFGTMNVDEVDPGRMSLDLFSADEIILQDGGNLLDYQGFTYTGQVSRSRVSFNDFFNDANNRPIGSFNPSYFSVFLEDKFEINDLILRLGLRADRFDANTNVLRDDFSLTRLANVGELGRSTLSQFGGGFTLPEIVGNDWNIYVDGQRGAKPQEFTGSNFSDFRILGFRDGSRWYDASGTELVNPQTLIDQGALPFSFIRGVLNNGGNEATVWRQSGITYSGDMNAFRDYTPVWNLMPRVSFSFPISEDALFYAHYDVLTRRPTNLAVTPLDYFVLRQNNGVGSPISNPNLIPQLTIDYQLGFQQRLSNSSSLKIAAFYRDFRNQIQQVPRIGAYLGNDALENYFTFDNIDYGTSKGLTFDYELRRTKNLTMFASYTLSFAEGTGSGEVSNAGINRTLSQIGQQNLRILVPLSFDRRHAFKLNLDYRFKENEGFEIFGIKPLENVGFNLTSDIGSGTPYTRNGGVPSARIGGIGNPLISGQINSSRLPWNYRFGFRVDKSWNYKSEKSGSMRSINAYLYVQNLLDTRNVQSVYAFTGSPTDDGFLDSAFGVQYATQNVSNTPAFLDVYNMALQNPDVFSLPRRIRLGLTFTF